MERVIIKRKALKALRKMPAKVSQSFMSAFAEIANLNTAHLDISKLRGRDGYRLRIGSYRAIYKVEGTEIIVTVLDAAPQRRHLQMSAQFIEQDGHTAFAVVPINEYKSLLEKAEMLDDVVAFDRAEHELATGEDELVPAAIALELLGGANPVKVWRKHRGLSQVQLAADTGVSQAAIAQIESGKRTGSVAVLGRIAAALDVDLDDLADL